jgi:hypothetical protein
MPTCAVTRRVALSGFGALAVLSGCPARRAAAAQSPLRFRDIRVDVWRLRASAGDQTADWVEDELPPDLARAFAPYMAPAERDGATLLARVDTLDLGGAGGARGSGRGAVDSIEGILILEGARGGLAAKTPLRAIASYQPDAVDQALSEEGFHQRVSALAQAFAGGASRELGF